ncbi:MAG TPA: hypothetical protein VK894_00650 [Jiangellales bacterium]|nr:hypothetical protein [Jiangellales bacterium]
MIAIVLAMLTIVVLAAAVLVYVAFPFSGHDAGPLHRVTGPLARLADRMRPTGSVPPEGLLSSPERDEQMSRRFEEVEHRLAHPFSRRQ